MYIRRNIIETLRQSFDDVFALCLFIILLVRFGLLSGHLLGNSCPLGWPFVLNVFCLFVILFISHFGFKSGLWLVIAPVPVHCFSITFNTMKKQRRGLNRYNVLQSCVTVGDPLLPNNTIENLQQQTKELWSQPTKSSFSLGHHRV